MNPDQKVSQLSLPHEIEVNRNGIRKVIIMSSLRGGIRMAYYETDYNLNIEREDGIRVENLNLTGEENLDQVLAKLLPKQVE